MGKLIAGPRWRLAALGVLAAGLGLAGWMSRRTAPPATTAPPPDLAAIDAPVYPEATEAQVRQLCGACHPTPLPEQFARHDWPAEVVRGYGFFRESGLDFETPPAVEVVRYYRNRAPKALGPPERAPQGWPQRFHFAARGYRVSDPGPPTIAHVRFARLLGGPGLDVLACDLEGGRVLALPAAEPDAEPIVLADGLSAPAHAEVVDLDDDGTPDVLVAALGETYPSDATEGAIVWLRGEGDRRFTPYTLASGLGRTCDVQCGDLDGDGDLDLVVAVFGYDRTGSLLLLENQSQRGGDPRFVSRTIDPRHGAVNVCVADLNGDGHLDLAVVYGQEHERVEAYLNRGDATFETRTIHAAPHPAYGSNGLQLCDLDGDGDLDALYSHGDALDKQRLNPEHGVHWLENRGTFPFVAHPIDAIYGAQRPVAADFDGDGDLDVAVTTFLPGEYYLRYRPKDHDALVLYEQTEPGRFLRHPLLQGACDLPSCDVADIDGDGRSDLVAGVCEIGLQPGSQLAYSTGRDGILLWRGAAAPSANDPVNPRPAAPVHPPGTSPVLD